MAKTVHYHTKFQCECFYHIYNRTVDKKPMFRNEGNYLFFLKKYDSYLSSIIETYAYNLLGNHFHLLIKVQHESFFDLFKEENPNAKALEVTEIVSRQFRKFFQSYAMAFNKQQERTGTLFQTPFKKVHIDNPKYLQSTIAYIHQNAQHHGLVDDFRDWQWSSYNTMLSEKETKIKRIEVLEYFDGKANFQTGHHNIVKDNVFMEIEL